jgi:acetyl-CoA synthetase
MPGEEIVWEPYGYYKEKSNISQFIKEYGYESYTDTSPQNEEELSRFWDDAMEDFGVIWEKKYDKVLDTSGGYPFTDWFVGGKLNATQTLLDKWVERSPDRIAFAWNGETGRSKEYTYQELEIETNKVANGLREQGIGKGDKVGIIFPLHPKAIIASLACLKIGAIQTHIFPGYGDSAIQQRLNDLDTEIVLILAGYVTQGNKHNL